MRIIAGRAGRNPPKAGRGSGPVERLPVESRSPWWAEHRSRYRFAQPFVASRSVLDVASGSGYGSEMLERAGAARVVGCDVDGEAVARSRERFGSSKVSFVRGDGRILPFHDEDFDVAVSLETLEHIDDGEEFVRETGRVLKPEGTLILSTPNAEVTGRYPRNPFHVREYRPAELAELLARHYAEVTLLGQTLDPRFRIAPFLPGWDAAKSLPDHMHLWAWKAALRLPSGLRDAGWGILFGYPFHPGEEDYRFGRELDRAHVLLAVCRRPR